MCRSPPPPQVTSFGGQLNFRELSATTASWEQSAQQAHRWQLSTQEPDLELYSIVFGDFWRVRSRLAAARSLVPLSCVGMWYLRRILPGSASGVVSAIVMSVSRIWSNQSDLVYFRKQGTADFPGRFPLNLAFPGQIH